MNAIIVISILVCAILGLGIFISSIIALMKAGKENPTTGEAKFATIMPPIGFGPLIGLIIYFFSTKKKFEGKPELEKAGKTGTIIGVAISVVLGLIVMIGTIALSVSAIMNFQNEKRQEATIKKLSPETVQEDEQSSSKLYEGKTFSIKMPCEAQTQSDAASNTTVAVCYDATNGSIMAAETITPPNSAIDENNPAQLELMLNSMKEAFSKSTLASDITSSNISHETKSLRLAGKGITGNSTNAEFQVKRNSKNELVAYQFVLIDGSEKEFSSQDLDEFIATAKFN